MPGRGAKKCPAAHPKPKSSPKANDSAATKKQEQKKHMQGGHGNIPDTRRKPVQTASIPAKAAEGANADCTPAMKRQYSRLDRRDSEEGAERAIEHRLSHLPSRSWEMLRNSKGESLRMVVREEVRRKRLKKGRLSTRFWESVYRDFGLKGSLATMLEEPETVEFVDPQLEEALSILLADNPVKRSVKPLERFLEYAPELTRYAWYALLVGVIESEDLPKARAMEAQLCVLKHTQRQGMHLKCPDYWKIFLPIFDQALKYDWESMSADGGGYI